MNVKSVLNGISGIEPKVRPEDVKGVKTEARHKDRDGNGRRDPGEEPRKDRLSDEEMQKVLAYLKALPGITNNNLVVRVESLGDVRVVYIQELSGRVVRRIPEPDLWSLIKDQDKKTGHIYDKAG